MLKIATWNVNGIRAREREVLALCASEQPDVLCLQEVKAAPEQLPASLLELPEYFCYWHGHKGYSGVALHLARRSFSQPVFSHPGFDHETRIVVARAGGFAFASVYVPNGGKDFAAKVQFLDALRDFAASAQAERLELVLCGDLNVAREARDVHPKLQDPEQIGQTPGERAQLERVIGCGLTDLSRKFQPDDDSLFSWWAPWRNHRQRNIGWRLDYVLASQALAERARECRVAREYGTSDHAPVIASLDLQPMRDPAAPEPPPPAPKRGQLTLF